MSGRAGTRSPLSWLLPIAILFLAAGVAWHDLGAHEVLGRDENATLTKLDQPSLAAVMRVVPIKVTGQPGNMQPLYFIAQYYFWPLVGRSAFMLRFLPAAFAILAVAATYKLGQALVGRAAGLRSTAPGPVAGALFTALLPLHVQYAQIARPYTLLALLSLAAAYALWRAWATDRPKYWAGFAVAGALAFYTHYNALFVLAALALYTGLAWLGRLAAAWRAGQPRRALARLPGAAAGWLALGLLCAPGLVQLAGLPWAGLGGGEPGAVATVQLTLAFFKRFLFDIGLTALWLRILVPVVLAVSLASLALRRRRHAILFVALWLAVPFLALAAVKSPRPFVDRYVIFVPPVLLLLAGEALAAAGRAVAGLATRLARPAPAWLAPASTAALAAVVALGLLSPLGAYYRANRAADRLGTVLAVVERHARAGDAILVSPRVLARPLAADGADVLYLPAHLSPAELDTLAGRYQRLWLLYSSYLPPTELQEPLDRWYQAHQADFARIPIKAITALAYRNLALTDAEANLKDRIALLEELADSSDKSEAWQRHEVLAATYQALGELYAGRGQADLAADCQARADAARAEAPPPW